VSFDGSAIVVEVHDQSILQPCLQPFNPTAARGRGLQLVNALAKSWRCIRDAGSKTVQAVIVLGLLLRCAMISLGAGSRHGPTLDTSLIVSRSGSGGCRRGGRSPERRPHLEGRQMTTHLIRRQRVKVAEVARGAASPPPHLAASSPFPCFPKGHHQYTAARPPPYVPLSERARQWAGAVGLHAADRRASNAAPGLVGGFVRAGGTGDGLDGGRSMSTAAAARGCVSR
jgi:hypothetical protein